MRREVWKYTLKDHINTLSMPEDFEILQVHEQANEVCMWVIVEPDLISQAKRTFHVVGTGKEIPSGVEYVGTAHVHFGTLVLHVFMEIER